MRRENIQLSDPPSHHRPGDPWMCGSTGTPCSAGPGKHGMCPLAEPCSPKRTWAGKRRIVMVAGTALFALLSFIIIQPSIGPAVFKPGELTGPHGQILSATSTSDRCGACHPAASMSFMSWFNSAESGHENVSQTERCMKCHHKTIQPSLAKLAHNLPRHTRERIGQANLVSAKSSWHDMLPDPAVSQENVQCSACHREHRGENASLVDLSDSQCQTCHSDRFGSFATSHPEWGQWPYGRGGAIAFDHQSHSKKHFPGKMIGGKSTAFDCRACHQRTANGELTRSVSYESCAKCHDESLNFQAAKGIDFVALPTLPNTVTDNLSQWPENAKGFADGSLSPLTEFMMRDQATVSAIRLFPARDFGRFQENDPAQIQALRQIANSHRELLADVAANGTGAMISRASVAGVLPDSIVQLFKTLPPQLVGDAYRQWFPGNGLTNNASSPIVRIANRTQDLNLTQGSDPLADDPLTDDPLAGDPLAEDALSQDPLAGDPLSQQPSEQPKSSRRSTQFDPSRMLPAGGWYRDDVRMSISYRGGGHADPILKSAVEFLTQLPSDNAIRKRLMQTASIQSCLACHPSANSVSKTWISSPLVGRKSEFTKFTHKPHLNIADLNDCSQCHRISDALTKKTGEVNLVKSSHEIDGFHQHEFEPIRKADCARCHQAKAAGEGCVDCHRYHIGQ